MSFQPILVHRRSLKPAQLTRAVMLQPVSAWLLGRLPMDHVTDAASSSGVPNEIGPCKCAGVPGERLRRGGGPRGGADNMS